MKTTGWYIFAMPSNNGQKNRPHLYGFFISSSKSCLLWMDFISRTVISGSDATALEHCWIWWINGAAVPKNSGTITTWGDWVIPVWSGSWYDGKKSAYLQVMSLCQECNIWIGKDLLAESCILYCQANGAYLCAAFMYYKCIKFKGGGGKMLQVSEMIEAVFTDTCAFWYRAAILRIF